MVTEIPATLLTSSPTSKEITNEWSYDTWYTLWSIWFLLHKSNWALFLLIITFSGPHIKILLARYTVIKSGLHVYY